MMQNPHYDISADKGPKGDKGERGIQGPKGDKGDTGSQGIKGDIGSQGPKGDKGDTGLQGVKGPKGDKGDTGSQGPKGDKGDTGSMGPQGQKGDKGAQGPKGDKGDKGDKGAQGPAGTFTTPTADVSFGNQKITNLGAPIDGTDAVNKNYADSRYIRAGDDINMGSQKITNLGNPTNNKDAVNKEYVDRRLIVTTLMPTAGFITFTNLQNIYQRTYNYRNGENISNYRFLLMRYHTIVILDQTRHSFISNTEFFPIMNTPTHISTIRLEYTARVTINFNHSNLVASIKSGGNSNSPGSVRFTITSLDVFK